MSTRYVVISVLLGLTLIVPACSTVARYRILTFFLDGVPEPGSARPQTLQVEIVEGEQQAGAEAAEQLTAGQEVYSHVPYREHQCGRCHNQATGRTFSTPEEGLCQTCHGPGESRFMHGPVAVKDCLFCHHHHTSTNPSILRTDVVSTCFRCHNRADLTVGEHHEQLDSQTCVECHDPHGGDNKFFLKRSGHDGG